MLTVTQGEFLKFVEKRYAGQKFTRSGPGGNARKKAVRSERGGTWQGRSQNKKLATCPVCDAVVNAEILHPFSGLCPICHESESL